MKDKCVPRDTCAGRRTMSLICRTVPHNSGHVATLFVSNIYMVDSIDHICGLWKQYSMPNSFIIKLLDFVSQTKTFIGFSYGGKL